MLRHSNETNSHNHLLPHLDFRYHLGVVSLNMCTRAPRMFTVFSARVDEALASVSMPLGLIPEDEKGTSPHAVITLRPIVFRI